MHTVNAMRALGIKIEQPEPTTLIVHGKKRVLTAPQKEINCGNSGTTMRLLAGLLAGQTFESRLVGDAGLSRRPMDRVIAPLCEMGASIVAEGPDDTAAAARPRRFACAGFITVRRWQAHRSKVRCCWQVFLPEARPLWKNRCRHAKPHGKDVQLFPGADCS